MSLGIYSGCRVAETASVPMTDGTADTLTITGKGGKRRVIYIAPQTQKLIKEWVSQRSAGAHCTTLLCNRHGNPASPADIAGWVVTQAERAGIARRVTSHMLRHTFASRLLEAGCQYEVISRLLGHSSASVTRRYTHLSADYMRNTIASAYWDADAENADPSRAPASERAARREDAALHPPRRQGPQESNANTAARHPKIQARPVKKNFRQTPESARQ